MFQDLEAAKQKRIQGLLEQISADIFTEDMKAAEWVLEHFFFIFNSFWKFYSWKYWLSASRTASKLMISKFKKTSSLEMR